MNNLIFDILETHALFIVACNKLDKEEIIRLGLLNLLNLRLFCNEKILNQKTFDLKTPKEVISNVECRKHFNNLQDIDSLLSGMLSYINEIKKGLYGVMYSNEVFQNFVASLQEIMYRLANYLPNE